VAFDYAQLIDELEWCVSINSTSQKRSGDKDRRRLAQNILELYKFPLIPLLKREVALNSPGTIDEGYTVSINSTSQKRSGRNNGLKLEPIARGFH